MRGSSTTTSDGPMTRWAESSAYVLAARLNPAGVQIFVFRLTGERT